MRNDSGLATEPKKRELFARLAEHFKVLVGEIEKAMGPDGAVTSGKVQATLSEAGRTLGAVHLGKCAGCVALLLFDQRGVAS